MSGAVCTPAYGTELATAANATDIAGEEADAYTVEWKAQSTPLVLDSIDTAPQGGTTYHLSVTADSNGDGTYRALAGTAGNLYKVSLYARHNGTASADGEFRCYLSASANTTDTYLSQMFVDANQDYVKSSKMFYLNPRQDTVVCLERNAANDGGLYIDTFSYLPVTTQCLGSELWPTGNAASIDGEANSIGTLTFVGSGGLTSESDAPGDGTYYLKQTSSADGDRFYLDLSAILSVGTKYFIKWKQIAKSGDGFTCGLSSASTSAFTGDASEVALSTATDTAWFQVGFDFTYATASHRYFKCWENGVNNNAVFGVDGISIKAVISE